VPPLLPVLVPLEPLEPPLVDGGETVDGALVDGATDVPDDELELDELVLVPDEAVPSVPHWRKPYEDAAVEAESLAVVSSASAAAVLSPRLEARSIFWPAATSASIAVRKSARSLPVEVEPVPVPAEAPVPVVLLDPVLEPGKVLVSLTGAVAVGLVELELELELEEVSSTGVPRARMSVTTPCRMSATSAARVIPSPAEAMSAIWVLAVWQMPSACEMNSALLSAAEADVLEIEIGVSGVPPPPQAASATPEPRPSATRPVMATYLRIGGGR
jgi:hypothetical protein